MTNIQNIYNKIQEYKTNYKDFQEGEEMQDYASQYQKAENKIVNSVQNFRPRIQSLIQSALTSSESFEEYINTGKTSLDISLDLIAMFKAGYSTNVDLEIQEDYESMTSTQSMSIQYTEKTPLFNESRSQIHTRLGKLVLQREALPKKPLFGKRAEIIPANSMGISEMNNRKLYQNSQSLPDQLAYHFYKNTDLDAERFCWLGDHQQYQGINGLSGALYFLINNYIYKNENTYTQPIYSIYTDLIKKSPLITEFNKIFAGYIEIDVTTKPGCMVYKLLKV